MTDFKLLLKKRWYQYQFTLHVIFLLFYKVNIHILTHILTHFVDNHFFWPIFAFTWRICFRIIYKLCLLWALTGGSDIKESTSNVGDLGFIPGLRRSPGEGNSPPPQWCCLENSMDEEHGRLQSTGSQRAGHDWPTFTDSHTVCC